MMAIKTGIYGLALVISTAVFIRFTTTGPPVIPRKTPTALIPPWFAFNIGCKLHEVFTFFAFVTQPPDAYVIELSSKYWDSEVSYALTKNKILDAVQNETSITCEKVAEKLDLDAFIVCRYMESGVYLNLLNKEPSTKAFSITTHGALLTETGELKDFMLMVNELGPSSWRAVSTDMIKDVDTSSRKSGMEIHFGMNAWDYFTEHPEEEAQFDRAMKSLSPTPTGAMLMDWRPPSKDATFCDIGGGVGALTAEVLNHYPEMTGIVFDRPEVIPRAEEHLASMGVTDRSKAVAGSFFDDFPEELADCDVFNLRYIVHDWDDASNVKILQKIREIAETSVKEHNRVVLIEDHIIETGAPSFFERAKSLMSINMIAHNPYGSRERTVQEHADLFEAAGYKNKPIHIHLRSILSMVQVEL